MDRSRSRERGEGKDDHKPRDVQEAARAGNSETEIVSVAIKQLPGHIRERLEKLFEEGLLKEGDLDLRSITVFASLNEGLQARVMNHMENERIYVANARSKSGFLIATCDKAKTGCLDARGLGAIDPWRTALVAMATPKQQMIDLKPERDWLDSHGEEAIKININVSGPDVTAAENDLGVSSVTIELPLTETTAGLKAKLVAMGVRSIPPNRMMFHTEPVGFLKERYTFAFYNLEDGVNMVLSQRKRAGTRFRRDHTVMPKRPRTHQKAEEAKKAAPAAATPALPAPALTTPAVPAASPAPPTQVPTPGTSPAPDLARPKESGMPLQGPGMGMPGMPGMGMPGGMPGGMGGPGMGMPGMGMPGGMPGMPNMNAMRPPMMNQGMPGGMGMGPGMNMGAGMLHKAPPGMQMR